MKCESRQIRFLFDNLSISVLLFAFFLLVYSLTIYGRLRYGDEADRYLELKSLVKKHTFSIPPVSDDDRIGIGGTNYNRFELGYEVFLAPPYILGHIASDVFPLTDRDWLPTMFVGLVNPMIAALTCLVLFQFGRALGMSNRIAVWMTLLFGLATVEWPYTKGLNREPLQGLALLLSLYGIFIFRQTRKRRWFWISAISAGYLVFTKIADLILLLPILVYVLIDLNENVPEIKQPGRLVELTKRLVLYLIPLALFAVIQGVVNLIKFGTFLAAGPRYDNDLAPYFSLSNVAVGVFGFLFSAPKSLFIYSPPLILCLPAWFALLRSRKREAILLLSLIAIDILLYSSFINWHGGSFWGPRYLVELVPLAILPLGVLLESAKGWKRWLWGGLSAAVFLMGLGVQIIGGLTDDRKYLDVMDQAVDVFGAFDFLRHGAITSLAISLSPPGQLSINPYGWLLIGFVFLLGVGIALRVFVPTYEMGRHSEWRRVAVAVTAIAVQVGGLWAWVIVPYPSILAAQGNTDYGAADAYYTEHRYCEAYGLYLQALDSGTSFARQAMSRVEEIQPRAHGTEIEIQDLAAQVMGTETAQVENDAQVVLTSASSLKIRVLARSGASAEANSEFIPVAPNTQYELSGWLKAEGIDGTGFGVIGWYEDDGNWRGPRSIDIIHVSGTRGWQPYQQIITTLPTTRRVLLKAGIWQAYGTMWVDGVHLVQIGKAADQIAPLCAK